MSSPEDKARHQARRERKMEEKRYGSDKARREADARLRHRQRKAA